jgi:serine/threonine protein phosphatase 1
VEIFKRPFERDESRRPLDRLCARVPDGLVVYAIGDIHGRADLLEPILDRIHRDSTQQSDQRAITVFLGDYVDRGPRSREVIDLLLEWNAVYPSVFLKGNHDQMAIDFLENPSVLNRWSKFGGIEMLMSYGVMPKSMQWSEISAELSKQFREQFPVSHLAFLRDLKSHFVCGDYFFVHAGVRPGVPLNEQRLEDLLWIRDEFLNYNRSWEKIIVHGHTPVSQPDVRSNRINLDTGAYATGRLTCAIFSGSDLKFLQP